VRRQFRPRGVAAGTQAGIAIDFGRGLRAEKATRAAADAQIEMSLIARHQPAAETARVSPHAPASGAGREQFHRAGGEGGGDGTLAGNRSYVEYCMAQARMGRMGPMGRIGRNWDFGFHTVRCCLTISSLRWAIGPSATIEPRSMM